MSRHQLLNTILSEVTTLGGVPLRRSDVVRILQAEGFTAECVDFFAFSQGAIEAEPMTVEYYYEFIGTREIH